MFHRKYKNKLDIIIYVLYIIRKKIENVYSIHYSIQYTVYFDKKSYQSKYISKLGYDRTTN